MYFLSELGLTMSVLRSILSVLALCAVMSGITGNQCPPGSKTNDAQGRCCNFPFWYKGVIYHSCTTVDYDDIPWCSLDLVYSGKWAVCVSGETTPSRETTPSGETTPSTGMVFGSGVLLVSSGQDYKCDDFTFKNPFASGDVRVQLRLNSSEYAVGVTWVQSVSTSGFRGCVRTTTKIRSNGRKITLQWLAYQNVAQDDGYADRRLIPLFTAGTKCVEQSYQKVYPRAPFVFLTAVHKSAQGASTPDNRHDAAIVWAEDVALDKFRACVRELKNFDGIHKKVHVEILVLFNMPHGWNVPWHSDILFPNTDELTVATGYSFCKTVNFTNEFYKAPTIITTSEHHKDNNKATIDADNNAMQEWVKTITKTNFEVCLKDIQRYDARHDPITVNYMAVGHYHPCINISCPFYGVCEAASETTHNCVCKACEASVSEPLCDNNDVTHKSTCEYKYKVCTDKEEPGIKHYGGCKPFLIKRGRVALRLDTVEVQCRLVYFKSSFDASRGAVRVQTSVNYFNHTAPSFVHDAAVTWLENVNINSFEVCALKAGRNDRVTLDGGLTFVDYVAFQEAPVKAIAGQEIMKNWWDGTKCQTVYLADSLQSCQWMPDVLVSAEHTRRGLKHDAATVWVENLDEYRVGSGGYKFEVCLRELQNFDGQHKDIKVNWFIYCELPEHLLSEQTGSYFAGGQPPVEDHHAFCQDMPFFNHYQSPPTVIVSAAHKGSLSDYQDSEYNSIATWVEQISSKQCRICMKELINAEQKRYDPLDVNVLVMGIPINKCINATAVGVAKTSIVGDDKMNASSQLSGDTRASYGRLNDTRGEGWCAKDATSSHEWLEVALDKRVHVCSVKVQGEVDGDRWVTDFKLRYYTAQGSLEPYMNANGAQVEFHRTGVTNSSTVTSHTLPVPITTSVIRFNPTKQHKGNCLRVEVFGYEV